MTFFKKNIYIILVLINVLSCSSVSKNPTPDQRPEETMDSILDHAEAQATPSGRRILEASRSMIKNQEIIVGGCWDYINTVYNRVGFSTNLRATIFKSKLRGPYVKAEHIEPGDWLYFVNHSYSGTEHSALFVAWINEEKKEALMVSYEGEKRKKPAQYKKFLLNKIYNIIRPKS